MVEYGTQMRRENLRSEKEAFGRPEKYLRKFLKKVSKNVLTKADESDILFELSKKRTATNIEN